MSTLGTGKRTPIHLWVIGIVSLLWNLGGGGSDHIMTVTGNEAYLQAAANTVGLELSVVQEYFAAFPMWMHIFWAIGVWGAVAGSILLLLRNRFAAHAFIASLIGIAASSYYQFSTPFPGQVDSIIPTIMAVLVPLITLALIFYARRQTSAGVLR